MGRNEHYIIFTKLSNELHNMGYMINIKYKIIKESSDAYCLGNNWINKNNSDNEYIIGNIIKPRG